MSDKKDIRKQIRNVLQEDGGAIAIQIAVAQCDKLITDKLADLEAKCIAKLDAMAVAQEKGLAEMNKKSRNVQGYLVGLHNEVQTLLQKNEDSIAATIKVLAESGVTVSDLAEKVAAKMPEVRAEAEAAAAKAMQDRLEKERADAEAKSNEAASA